MGQQDKKLERYLANRLAEAEHGKAEALYDLGLLFSTGQGVDLDYVTAHQWFNLAAMHGIRRAKVDREELAQDMSDWEIAEAQRLAREWLTCHKM